MSDAIARLLSLVAGSPDGRAGAARADVLRAGEPGAAGDADFGALVEAAGATASEAAAQPGGGAPGAQLAAQGALPAPVPSGVSPRAIGMVAEPARAEASIEAVSVEGDAPAAADLAGSWPSRPRPPPEERLAADLAAEDASTATTGAVAPSVSAFADAPTAAPEAAIGTSDRRLAAAAEAPAAAGRGDALPLDPGQAVAAPSATAPSAASPTADAPPRHAPPDVAPRADSPPGAAPHAETPRVIGTASVESEASAPARERVPEQMSAPAPSGPSAAGPSAPGVPAAPGSAPPAPDASPAAPTDGPDAIARATSGADADARAPDGPMSSAGAGERRRGPSVAGGVPGGAPVAGSAAPASTPSPGGVESASDADRFPTEPSEPATPAARRDARRAAAVFSPADTPATDAARAPLAASADSPAAAQAGLVESQETAGALAPEPVEFPAGDARTGTDRADAPARLVARSILAASESGRIELRLDPPELGRVTIDLTLGEDAVSAAVSAERPETLDLLRRHGDVLQRELAQAGFGRADIGFSDRQPGADARAGRGEPAFAAPEPTPPAPFVPVRAPAPVARDRLDIRL